MPVGEMLQRMSGQELAEWQAYERVYGPIGVEERLDRTAAVIANQVANSLRGPKSKPSEVDDFMPRWGVRPVDDGGGV
jgi:hypothetical protein